MSNSWYEGDRAPVWTIGLEPDSGTLDVSGYTVNDFTMKFINTSNGVITIGTGTFSNLTAASGSNPASIQYQPSLQDVATPGFYDRRVVIKQGTIDQRTFDCGTFPVVA